MDGDIELLPPRRFISFKSYRAPDKVRNFSSKMPISTSNPMFDQLDSNKWSNIGFGEEMTQVELIKVHFTHLIWSSGHSDLASWH